MKKHLFLGSALLISISAYPQQQRKFKATGCINTANELKKRFSLDEATLSQQKTAQNGNVSTEEPIAATNAKSSSASAAITVLPIGGSINAFGMLESATKNLRWNKNVDAVTFLHRKSPTYVASPGNNSGAIVTLFSANMGANWDSTCIWADPTNAGRFPQGGLYSAPGNTNLQNAYIVGMGPTVAGNAFSGTWLASKQVSVTPKNAQGTDVQFFGNVTPTGPFGKADYVRTGFDITDDGVVHGIGPVFVDINNTTTDGLSGAEIIKGVFTAGAFTWSSTNITPPVITDSAGDKVLTNTPHMAWNEAGTVGYAMFFGSRQGATGSNVGLQPLIYKTTNSGTSWSLLNGIDFNSPAMQPVLDRIATVASNSNLAVPFFSTGDGIDITVDANNNLHIGCFIQSSNSNHPDSTFFLSTFGGRRFIYTGGGFPYIYDFMGDGSAPWKFYTIDSAQTEAPSGNSAASSFSANPITDSDANGNKQVSSSRLQLSRSIVGDRIAFVYVEGDTTQTTSKFLQFPNIKARLVCVANNTVTIDPNITNMTANLPSGPINNRVKGKAFFHHVSPKMKASSNSLFQIPITVTNSAPLVSQGANSHYYISGEISNFACILNIDENKPNAKDLAYGLIPNPAKDKVSLSVKLNTANTIDVSVYNTVGQLVKQLKNNGEVGENNISLSLENLTSGIYMVKVSVNGLTTTKKLIVE